LRIIFSTSSRKTIKLCWREIPFDKKFLEQEFRIFKCLVGNKKHQSPIPNFQMIFIFSLELYFRGINHISCVLQTINHDRISHLVEKK